MGFHVPLVLARIVQLATLVYSNEAFTDQFAANHRAQNTAASFAVSRVVKGGSGCGVWRYGWNQSLVRVSLNIERSPHYWYF